MGSTVTDFHAAAAAAFDQVRGMTDGQCREVELGLFRIASAHHGAPDAADRVLARLEGAPHRGFRPSVLVTIRALVRRVEAGGGSPEGLRELLADYLAGRPEAACLTLRAPDMDRYT